MRRLDGVVDSIGHEFEQTLGDGEEQRSLACCSPWGRKESATAGWTEQQSSTTPYNLITSVKILFPNRVIDHSAGTWGFHISFWRTQFNLRHSPGGDSNPSQGYHQVACEMWWRKLQAWKVGSGKVQDYREMGSQRGGNWRTLWAMERPAGITGRVPGRTKDT